MDSKPAVRDHFIVFYPKKRFFGSTTKKRIHRKPKDELSQASPCQTKGIFHVARGKTFKTSRLGISEMTAGGFKTRKAEILSRLLSNARSKKAAGRLDIDLLMSFQNIQAKSSRG